MYQCRPKQRYNIIYNMRLLSNFLCFQKPSLTELELCKKEILKIVDSNKDGKISRDELGVLLSSN